MLRRIFVSPDQIRGDEVTILAADAEHIARVLRLRCGDALAILDGAGNGYRAILVTVGRATCAARIVESVPLPAEPPVRIVVAQALGKGDKFEQVVQHGSEAGACGFVALTTERAVPSISQERVESRVMRWRLIAKGAAEQSGRSIVPAVEGVWPLREALLKQRSSCDLSLMLHPSPEAPPLKQALQQLPGMPQSINLFVGPEGGWSGSEVAAACAAGAQPVSLGHRILRTETAALVAISQILYEFGG